MTNAALPPADADLKGKSVPLTLRIPSELRARTETHRVRLSSEIGAQISFSMAVIHLMTMGLGSAQVPVTDKS